MNFRLIYNGKRSIFEQLFDKYSSDPIRFRKPQNLAIEMYKIVNDSSTVIMNGFLNYNSQHQNTFKKLLINTVYNGTEKC